MNKELRNIICMVLIFTCIFISTMSICVTTLEKNNLVAWEDEKPDKPEV